MNPRVRLHIRVDATTTTGLGHFMRCLAIAQQWQADHGPVTFIGTFNDALHATLERDALDAVGLPGIHPDESDIEATVAAIDPGAMAVLDGYQFDYGYQSRLAEHSRLLVIDDLGQLPRYAGTILLNANFNATDIPYADAPSHRLLGPRYAMLRREIIAAGNRSRAICDPVARVLVSLGGADSANDTLRILRSLCALDPRPATVRVIAGPINPHGPTLRAFASERSGITVAEHPVDMPAELVDADLVIASAGTISAELAFLGKPCILFAVADNQLRVGPAMASAGAAIYGGDLRRLDGSALLEILRNGLADTTEHESMRTAGPRLVDGQGTKRICRELSGGINV